MNSEVRYDKTKGFKYNLLIFFSKLFGIVTGQYLDLTKVDFNEVDEVDYSDYLKPPKGASLWERLTWDPEEAYLRDIEFEDIHESGVLDFNKMLTTKLAAGDTLHQAEESV